jgi:hypothetical protein
MIEAGVFEQILTTEINKLPKEMRAEQTDILRAALDKAQSVLDSVNSTLEWEERVLRTMAAQFTIWRGQPKETEALKKKR